jgi:hypothetical protein
LGVKCEKCVATRQKGTEVLSEENVDNRLRAFEKRVLRRIFGSKRDEVKGGWRELHDE